MPDFSDHRYRNFLREALIGAQLRAMDSIKAQANRALDEIYTRYVAKDGDFAPAEVITHAARNEDIIFLERMSPFCEGIKKLKEDGRYLLLKAIDDDDIGYVKFSGILPFDINRRSFWSAEDAQGRNRVYFLSPAHLVRSAAMAQILHERGARFDLPDAEGRLPLYTIARRAVHRGVFPLLMNEFHANAHYSGRARDEISPLDGPLYDPPIFQAVRHANTHALKGLEMLAPAKIDMNVIHNYITPLMFAVIRAEEAFEDYDRLPSPARKLAMVRHLWILQTLAASPCVDPAIKDYEGWSAESHATSKPVRAALLQGLAQRFTP